MVQEYLEQSGLLRLFPSIEAKLNNLPVKHLKATPLEGIIQHCFSNAEKNI